jgi:hypothetical protein
VCRCFSFLVQRHSFLFFHQICALLNNWKQLYDTTSKELAGKTFEKDDDKVYFILDAISGDPKTNVEFKHCTVTGIKVD